MTEIQPILLSAITCNRVIFDKISGMPSIIDIVQTINAQNELLAGRLNSRRKPGLMNTKKIESIITNLIH